MIYKLIQISSYKSILNHEKEQKKKEKYFKPQHINRSHSYHPLKRLHQYGFFVGIS